MPYCSVEEAWGKDFIEDSDKFKKIVPEKSYDSVEDNSSEYSDTDVYNSDGSEVFEYSDKYKKKSSNKKPKNKKSSNKKPKNKTNFSRTYNRLDDHRGPLTRLPTKNYNINQETTTKNTNENNKELYFNYIVNENKQLKKLLNNFKNISEQDNIFDVALFICAGIFIIFFLDILTNNIKRI